MHLRARETKKVELRVASAISESRVTSRTSSSHCPHFYFHTPPSPVQCLSHLLTFDLMVLSQYGLGLMFVDSVFKIIPDLLTPRASSPLFRRSFSVPPPPFLLSHVRLDARKFLIHMAIASIERTWGADSQHGAVVIHSTKAKFFWESGPHIGHHPGRSRCWQI